MQLTDVSLQSELETVVALENAAAAAGRRHAIVAMVDLGDLREGMLPKDLPAFLERVNAMDHIDIAGIGVNLTCYGAIVPDEDNLGRLAELAAQSEKQLGRPLLVSGGNSGSDRHGRLRAHARGRRHPAHRRDHPPRRRHAHARAHARPAPRRLHRLRRRSSSASSSRRCRRAPSPRTRSATTPAFTDRGERRRAILALGRQDAPPEGLRPVDPRVEVLGASSDHLIVDVEALDRPPRLGDSISFVPTYAATLQLSTSPYVQKVFTPPA